MSQQAALNAGREVGAASSPSPRGTGRGRGFEDFLPPREKLSFLWRTMFRDRTYKSRGEYDLVETLVLRCVGVPKKFQSKHKRHTCKLLRLPSSGLHLTTLLRCGGQYFFPHQHRTARENLSTSSIPSYPINLLVHSPTVILEAASARMAARDRFGAYAEPGLSPLQRAIRELSPTSLIIRTDRDSFLIANIT
jgi:hypothetical protein